MTKPMPINVAVELFALTWDRHKRNHVIMGKYDYRDAVCRIALAMDIEGYDGTTIKRLGRAMDKFMERNCANDYLIPSEISSLALWLGTDDGSEWWEF